MSEKAAKAQPRVREPETIQPSQEDLQRWIAEAAYYRAESRGFQPGSETQDWLSAEAEILARVHGGAGLI
jgi:hypothetical protein